MAILAGCAAPPAPIAPGFDRSASEPAAIAVAEAAIAAAGGAAAWSEVRELGWLQGLVVDGMLARVEELVWDRAEHRLRHVRVDTSGAVTVVLRDLDDDGGSAYRLSWNGQRTSFGAGERARLFADSRATWERDGFLLALPFSLQWPGVQLALAPARAEPTVRGQAKAAPRYDVLRVIRAGRRELLYVVVNRETRLPVLIEIERESQPGREGWRLSSWARAGGVLLATRREALPAEGGERLPFVMPPKWRGRIALSPSAVPARGVLVVVGALSARAQVEASLFVPSVAP